ncbi:MAG: GNAT family N-acetyltransferase [Halopseudomonas aestusnigri]
MKDWLMVPVNKAPEISVVDIQNVILETDRLLLRSFTENDFEVLYGLRRQKEVVRYLYGEVHTPEETRKVLEQRLKMTTLDKDDDKLILAVEEKTTGAFVGDLVLILTSKVSCQGEIGFVFNPDLQGRGYGYEASQVILRFGFENLNLSRIAGRCDPRNIASAGLLRKLGLKQEAHLIENVWAKGEWTDELIFAIRKSQYDNEQ